MKKRVNKGQEAPHPNARAIAAQEMHQRHAVAWLATLGTLAVIVALWIMILPTQIGDLKASGRATALPTTAVKDSVAAQTAAFQSQLDHAGAQLDAIDAAQADAATRAAVAQGVDKLRADIAASATTQNALVAPAAPAPAAPKPAVKKK